MGNNGKIGNFPIPKLSNPSNQGDLQRSDKSKYLKDFKNVLQQKIDKDRKSHGVDISLHAAKRIKDRNLEIDSEEFIKLRGAINKLRDKGGKESLVITDKAAYIVDVNKNRIVTAIDKNKMGENVFTKIDSTLVIN